MIRAPFEADWNASQAPPHRRAYLESELSFEEIAARIANECEITGVLIEPYDAPAPGEPKNARQVVFRFRVSHEACDLFFNAPDGLRGRYWQSPDHGLAATRHLIDGLSAKLSSYATRNPPTPLGKAAPMAIEGIAASLSAPSAKIWLRERDDKNEFQLLELPPENQLIVRRWLENESQAPINKGMWRRTPKGGEMEVKGAILGVDGTEYVPEGKRDRSCQIHRFGFT
jgi:hypothetical protein